MDIASRNEDKMPREEQASSIDQEGKGVAEGDGRKKEGGGGAWIRRRECHGGNKPWPAKRRHDGHI